MAKERTPGVESARRVLMILLMFNEDKPELTVDDVMEAHGISQTSAYRYLSLLRELRLIQLRTRGTYVLTPRVHRLAAASEDAVSLEHAAMPTLRKLSELFHETAFMMRRARNEAVFVASSEPDRALALSFRAGSASLLHRGAVAKVLLAHSSHRFQRAYIDRYVGDSFERERMMNEMEHIRVVGYSESVAEVDEGIWGGAVPVLLEDTVIASLSVAGPEFRILAASRSQIIDQLKAGAKEIARAYESELEGFGGHGDEIYSSRSPGERRADAEKV